MKHLVTVTVFLLISSFTFSQNRYSTPAETPTNQEYYDNNNNGVNNILYQGLQMRQAKYDEGTQLLNILVKDYNKVVTLLHKGAKIENYNDEDTEETMIYIEQELNKLQNSDLSTSESLKKIVFLEGYLEAIFNELIF